MPSMKGSSWAAPRWMRFRYASHWPVMTGLFTSGCTTSIRWMPLSVASRILPFAHHVVALQQHFDDGGARGGSAQAGLLHGVGEFFFVERLAGGFHGGEQRGFGEALGGAGFLLQRLDVQHGLRLALGETTRAALGVILGALLAAFSGPMSSTFQPTCWTTVPEE